MEIHVRRASHGLRNGEPEREEMVGEVLGIQGVIGRQGAYYERERACQRQRETNRSVVERRIDATRVTKQAGRAAQNPSSTTAREREISARDITAERRSDERRERRAERSVDILGLNIRESTAGDPATENPSARDQQLFEQDVGRLRHFFASLKICTTHTPYHMSEATHWAPPGATGALSDAPEARRNARVPPAILVSVPFTTKRPNPTHTARGIRRPPTIVFCAPPAFRDPDMVLESLPHPSLDEVDEDDKRCHICQEAYTTDGRAVDTAPGKTWLHESQPEIPIRLSSCRHILGSHCLSRWFEPSNHNSCPICRTPVTELDEPDRYRPVRAGVLEALFKLARLMAEQGQISGMEYTYGYIESDHPGHIQVRVPQES